jgi:hypothetical protein
MRRDEGLGESAGLIPADAFGHRDKMFGRDRAMRGLRAAAGDGAHPATEQRLVHVVTDAAHDARHLEARYIDWPSRRGRVETLQLQEVGAIYSRRLHRDDDIVCTGYGKFAFGDFKFPFVDFDGPHSLSLRLA